MVALASEKNEEHLYLLYSGMIHFSNLNNHPEVSFVAVRDSFWSGVKSGIGSIFAAGNVVTSDVLLHSLFGRSPARIVKQQFSDEDLKEHSILPFEEGYHENLRRQSYFGGLGFAKLE